jgi:hypothetical protein
LHAAEQDRPDVAAERAALKAEQPKLDALRLIFIDETAVTTKMVRHYGRSPCGERLVASVPHGHWKTLTLVAALRIDSLTAPYVIDGAMDGLVPRLCRASPRADTAQRRYRLHG